MNTSLNTVAAIHIRWVAAVLVAAATLSGTAAWSQLTLEQLLAPTMEQISAEYHDVERALEAFRQGAYEQARQSLVVATEKHPELAPADVMMAMLYLSIGRRADADAAIEEAILQHPEDPEAYVLAADLGLRDGRLTMADLGYQRGQQLLEQRPTHSHRFRNLNIRLTAGQASLAEARGQFDRAAQFLDEWCQLSPDNPMPWGSLGRVRFHLNDLTAARQAFTKLREIDQNAPPAEIAMARLYSDAGMRQEARQSMEQACRDAGSDTRVRLTAAEWALQADFIELAEQQVAEVLKLAPESIGGQVLAARIQRQLENPEGAEAILTRAVLRSPDNFFVTNELARTLAVSADAEKRATGLQYARRNFQTFEDRASPFGRESAVTFAWLLLESGRVNEALGALNTLPDRSEISTENAFLVARIYHRHGQRAVAVGALEAALAADVHFPGRTEAERLRDELTRQD